MKRVFLLLIIIAGFSFMHLSSAATEEEKYYYAFEEKVPLVAKENTLLVKFDDGVDKTKASKYAWESEGMEKMLKEETSDETATYYPEAELVTWHTYRENETHSATGEIGKMMIRRNSGLF